jgi:hypothetical protein
MDKKDLSITDIQNWMQAMLIEHVPVSYLDTPATAIVKDSKRLDAKGHLAIYRHSYIARLRSCMQSQFKCLAYALGEALFQDFADHYLEKYPSNSYTLNTLGEKFPAFLEETRPQDENEMDDWPQFMIELARFEYALSEAFDAPEINTAPLNPNTPDQLLTTAPNLLLFAHQFPVCNFYIDFNAMRQPDLPFAQPSYCGVSRQNYKLGLFAIGADQYYFLNAIKSGASFEQAKDDLITFLDIKKEDFDKVWPIWKHNFITSGFIVEKTPEKNY